MKNLDLLAVYAVYAIAGVSIYQWAYTRGYTRALRDVERGFTDACRADQTAGSA